MSLKITVRETADTAILTMSGRLTLGEGLGDLRDSIREALSGNRKHIILKVIGLIVPLRMDEATLKVGDDAVHGETAYAIGVEGE